MQYQRTAAIGIASPARAVELVPLALPVALFPKLVGFATLVRLPALLKLRRPPATAATSASVSSIGSFSSAEISDLMVISTLLLKGAPAKPALNQPCLPTVGRLCYLSQVGRTDRRST